MFENVSLASCRGLLMGAAATAAASTALPRTWAQSVSKPGLEIKIVNAAALDLGFGRSAS